MPIHLNKTVVVVTDEFVTALKDIALTRANVLKREITNAGPHYRDYQARKNSPHISRLVSLFKKGEPGKRSGMDYEITRLKGLPYERFFVKDGYLCGRTTPVDAVCTTRTGYSFSGQTFHLGRYIVALSISELKTGSTSRVHLIPEKNPNTEHRHPHHTCDIISRNGNPLTATPYTCWGSFGPIAMDCAQSGDIPDLFRVLRTYLERIDLQSPLGGMNNVNEVYQWSISN